MTTKLEGAATYRLENKLLARSIPGQNVISDVKHDLLQRQVDVVNGSYRQLVVGTVIATLLLGGLLYQSLDKALLIPWVAMVWGLLIVRTWVYRRHLFAARFVENIETVAKEMVILAGFAGGLWGLGAILLLRTDDIVNLAVFTVVYAGMIAGCVALYASYKPIYLAFALPTILPTVAVMVLSGEVTASAFGASLFTFLLINIAYCRNIHDTIRESIELRHQNLELAADLNQKYSELEIALGERARFLASASHDLRQPLQALSLFHSVLKREYATGNPAIFSRMEAARQSLAEMFNGLLDMSSIESGQLKIEEEVVDVVSLVGDIVNTIEIPEAKAKKLSIKTDLEFGPLYARIDALLFGRIVRNIFSNAVKFTETGHIAISVRVQGSDIIVEITDTGPGIDKELLPVIFEDYQQIKGQKNEGGLGLGLSIVRELSTRLAVTVDVCSRVGVGTSFILSLPHITTPNETRKSAGKPLLATAVSRRLANLSIFFVEDEESVRIATHDVLTSEGANVAAFASMREVNHALEQLGLNVDLVLCDFHLGENESAFEVINAFGTVRKTIPPVIILTGAELDEAHRIALNPAAEILKKPVDTELLVDHILAVVNKSEAQSVS